MMLGMLHALSPTGMCILLLKVSTRNILTSLLCLVENNGYFLISFSLHCAISEENGFKETSMKKEQLSCLFCSWKCLLVFWKFIALLFLHCFIVLILSPIHVEGYELFSS